jgi:hypothetical protein
MMEQLIVGRIINDQNEKGEKYEFIIPDMVKLMNSQVTVGTEVLIPMTMRDNTPSFWESGGKNPNFASTIGTVIASANDELLDAILFNKLNKTVNSKQALMPLRQGYRLYVGKVNVRKNSLAPKIKVFRLVYTEIDQAHSDNNTSYGKFVLDEVFTSYSDLKGIVPGERLIDKLFTKDVNKPFFANGWSTSNINGIKDQNALYEAYLRIMSIKCETSHHYPTASDFLDAIENTLVRINNPKLSAAFQWIDFNTGIVGLKPLLNVELSNIAGTIGNADIFEHMAYTTVIPALLGGYNPNILFGSNDPEMLKLSLKYDDKYSIAISDDIYCILRGFRG